MFSADLWKRRKGEDWEVLRGSCRRTDAARASTMDDIVKTDPCRTNELKSGPIHQLDARRAYFVFLTHIMRAHGAGMRWPVGTVAEFGVGTHLGVGFCALLSGAQRFHGFDAVAHMDAAVQSNLLDELRRLFVDRSPAFNDAGEKAFDFPRHIFPDEALEYGTSLNSLTGIKAELSKLSDHGYSDRITYVAPYGECAEFAGSFDLLLSTATLEHVEQIERAYAIFHRLLKGSGYMSHSIDFKSHGFVKVHNKKKLWNGHWLLDDAEWREMTKDRRYSINRVPCSEHLKLIGGAGFRLLLVNKRMQESELKWSDLARTFQWMTAEDLACSGAHIVCVKG